MDTFRQSLGGGYCYGHCALERDRCEDEEMFRSSRQMKDVPNAHGGSCTKSKGVKEMVLGRCGDGTCTPNSSSCSDPKTYVTSDTNDDSCIIENTTFGSCDERCSWSPESCLAGEIWKFPAEDCSCDMVQVGGCMKDDDMYCSVSPKGCDEFSTWLSPLDTVTATGRTCFLCRENVPLGDAPIADAPVEDALIVEEVNLPTSTSLSQSSPLNKTTVIVGVSTGAVGFVVIALVSLFVIRRRAKTRKANEDIPKQGMEITVIT